MLSKIIFDIDGIENLLAFFNKKIESIAFPAISTGVFGYPADKANKVAFKTIIKAIPDLKYIKLIRFVLYGLDDLKINEEILSQLF